jgi:hypothetical protein
MEKEPKAQYMGRKVIKSIQSATFWRSPRLRSNHGKTLASQRLEFLVKQKEKEL